MSPHNLITLHQWYPRLLSLPIQPHRALHSAIHSQPHIRNHEGLCLFLSHMAVQGLGETYTRWIWRPGLRGLVQSHPKAQFSVLKEGLWVLFFGTQWRFGKQRQDWGGILRWVSYGVIAQYGGVLGERRGFWLLGGGIGFFGLWLLIGCGSLLWILRGWILFYWLLFLVLTCRWGLASY